MIRIMAPLRCCSYNCCGWNNGVIFLKGILDSIDLCFLQEHWLITGQLHKINTISDDFLLISVSGMDSFSLLAGRPFGGCAIIYRKSLSLAISRLPSSSNRFCAIRINTCDGKSYLMFSVYMPYDRSHLPLLTTLTLLVRYMDSSMLNPILESF